jgi:hypothetical protein
MIRAACERFDATAVALGDVLSTHPEFPELEAQHSAAGEHLRDIAARLQASPVKTWHDVMLRAELVLAYADKAPDGSYLWARSTDVCERSSWVLLEAVLAVDELARQRGSARHA